MESALHYFNIYVFAGQGTIAVNNPETRQQALRDAELPPCDVLLTACYDAFLSELASLPPHDFDDLELKLADFPTKRSLLALKTAIGTPTNPVVTGPTLFLVQTLRYLAFMEGWQQQQHIDKRTYLICGRSRLQQCNFGLLLGNSARLCCGLFNRLIRFHLTRDWGLQIGPWIGVRHLNSIEKGHSTPSALK